MLSDLMVVCELLHAACMGAFHIASANLMLMKDTKQCEDHRKRMSSRREEFFETYERVKGILVSQGM